MVHVGIKATSPNYDPWLRYWSVYINRQPTKYPYNDGDVVALLSSGNILLFEYDFKFGDYFYFVISSPPEYTYDVTVYIDNELYTRGKVNSDRPMKVKYVGKLQLPWWFIIPIAGVLAFFLLRKK